MAALMGPVFEQLKSMQSAIAALAAERSVPAAVPAAQAAPVVPVQATSSPVSPAPVSPAPVSAAPVSASPFDALEAELAALMDSQIAEVMELTWSFRLANGASAMHTGRELRRDLHSRVAQWWAHHNLGQLVFGVYVDGSDSRVVHVRVKSAAGQIKPRLLSTQVRGVAMTVRGLITESRKG